MQVRRAILLGILLFALPGLVRAGYKVGTSTPPYQLTDLVGYSGATDGEGPGWRRVSTIGYFGSAGALSNGREQGRVELRAGLWGGGSSMQSAGAAIERTFGFPHPARIRIPAGAMARDYLLYVGTSPATAPLHASAAVVQEALSHLSSPYTRPVGGRLFELFAVDDLGHAQAGLLRRPAILTLPFDDADGDGILDDSTPPIYIRTLSVWWLDEAHTTWAKVPDSVVDASQQSVTAPIRHFSVYAVMGGPTYDPTEASAFPVPWRPAGPNAGSAAGQSGTSTDGITFTNLPNVATIRIYTVAGAKVRELTNTNGLPQVTWDVKSDSGEEIATGTYIYVVDGNGSKKTGKLVVVR